MTRGQPKMTPPYCTRCNRFGHATADCGPDAPGTLLGIDPGWCVCRMDTCLCGPDERALRAWAAGEPCMPPMTRAQRQACVDECARVEGWNAEDVAPLDDAGLAGCVLAAWLDYARDKGLA